jgi:hypothetical protein
LGELGNDASGNPSPEWGSNAEPSLFNGYKGVAVCIPTDYHGLVRPAGSQLRHAVEKGLNHYTLVYIGPDVTGFVFGYQEVISPDRVCPPKPPCDLCYSDSVMQYAAVARCKLKNNFQCAVEYHLLNVTVNSLSNFFFVNLFFSIGCRMSRTLSTL